MLVPLRLEGLTNVLQAEGECVSLQCVGEEPGRLVLVAGRPLGEPVVQHGPFVMNTQAEVRPGHYTPYSLRLTLFTLHSALYIHSTYDTL